MCKDRASREKYKTNLFVFASEARLVFNFYFSHSHNKNGTSLFNNDCLYLPDDFTGYC